MTGRAVRLLVVAGVAAASVSCLSMYESRYPLGEDAKRVVVAPSGQQTSVELATHCRKTGRIQSVMSDHFARLEAAKVDANVAQVLTATTVNGRVQSLDVRFWSCAGDVTGLDLAAMP